MMIIMTYTLISGHRIAHCYPKSMNIFYLSILELL